MNLQDEAMDVFMERVSAMPDVEAALELELRKEKHAAELAFFATQLHDLDGDHTKQGKQLRAQIGQAIQVVNADNTRLRIAINETNRRRDAATWAKAVTAVYGQEGFERCRIWMFQNDPERQKNYKGLEALMQKYGLVPA